MSSVEDNIAQYKKEVVYMMEQMIRFGSSRIEEVDGTRVEMGIVDLGEILRLIAGFRARTTYLRVLLSEKTDGRYIRFTNNMLIPFLEELTEQFKIWSRVASVQELDWNMSRG